MKKLFLATVTLFSALCFAQGQVPSPDNRYDVYKGPKIQWPTQPPDLQVCAQQEYYEPASAALVKYFTPELARRIHVRLQGHDECVWMFTAGNKWRWVLRRGGTLVAQDGDNRDLFDLGRTDGIMCANPRPISIEIIPPAAPTPTPTPTPTPVTVKEVTYKFVVITELPPFQEWRPRLYTAVIVWDEHGRPRWSKIPGLNCIYEFGPGIKRHSAGDIFEKVGCIAAVVLPLTLPAGEVASAVKIGVCVPTVLPNGTLTTCH